MGTLWQDIRYGVRQLRKSPGFTAVAVLTLAIGIGGNTTMFSIVNTLLLRPPEVEHPDQLFGCYRHGLGKGYSDFSYSDYVEVREHNPAFDDLMAYAFNFVAVEQDNISKRSGAAFVSSNYFAALGTRPILGRDFLPEEERSGSAAVAVLSYRCWQRRGGDPRILGGQLKINNAFVQVVGVAPEGFTGATLTGPDLWLPLGCYDATLNGQDESRELYPSLMLIGRIKPGVSMSVAEAQLEALALRLAEKYPDRWREQTFQLARLARFGISNMPAAAEIERRMLSIASLFLMGISGVVLLIACHNLAHLYLVKGSHRFREIAMRMAVGGSRWRIMRQLLVECALLTGLGGAFGLVLALGGVTAINRAIGHLHLRVQATLAFEGKLDGRVLAATLGFCVLTTLLSGLRPAWRLAQRNLMRDLKEARGSVHQASRMALRRLSSACQVASSVVLVMVAVLLGRSALKALHATPGYNPQGKLLVEVSPEMAGYDRSQDLHVCEAVLEQLRAIPEIRCAGLSTCVPFGPSLTGCSVAEFALEQKSQKNEGEQPPARRTIDDVILNRIGGDYFQSLELPLLQGRTFNRLDHEANAARVVIIDEPLAHQLCPDGDALGRLIQMDDKAPAWQIVGIVPGLRHRVFDKRERPHIYVPSGRDERGLHLVYLHLQTRAGSIGDGGALAQRIVEAVHKVDPRIPVLSLTSLPDYHGRGVYVWFARTTAWLVTGFGALAVFLAALGMYEVKAYQVATRTPEIGIRMALGATRRDVLSAVLWEGASLTLVGLAVGFLLAFIAARAIAGILCDTEPIDPMSICATFVLVGAASLLATYLPARRAARIDPMAALRYE